MNGLILWWSCNEISQGQWTGLAAYCKADGISDMDILSIFNNMEVIDKSSINTILLPEFTIAENWLKTIRTNLKGGLICCYWPLFFSYHSPSSNPDRRNMCFQWLSVFSRSSQFLQLPTYAAPRFNCCTKCMGSLGIIHDHASDCHHISWSWMHGWPRNWN